LPPEPASPPDVPLIAAALLRIGPLEIRPAELQVFVDGRRTGLTVREFEVLNVLAHHADRVLTREAIYTAVWTGSMPRRDRCVDVFVRKVRLKLARAAPDWTFIHTHFGIGYRLEPERRGG